MTTLTDLSGFALFETPIGACGVVWGPRGLVGLQLPEGDARKTRARLVARFPGASEAPPPPLIRGALGDVVALLRGEARDLAAVPLDLTGVPPFHRRVYELLRTVPPGVTLSYGELAARLGSPGAARAVGQALRRNPIAIVVPCHRVLASGGKAGGFTATGGVATKLRLLALETRAPAAGGLFAGDGALGFDPAAAAAHLRASDPALARIIEAVGPCQMRLKGTPSLFVALAEAIVYQQLSGKAAATIYARLCALFPGGQEGPDPARLLRLSDERLRGAGLSRGKLLSLRDLAQKVEEGELPPLEVLHEMDDEAIIDRLTTVRGIGRWTVEMLLMFRLGRPDVLPLDDLGVRKGLAVVLRTRAVPGREALAKRGARWAPFRTAASWYLWRAAERGVPAAPPPPGLSARVRASSRT